MSPYPVIDTCVWEKYLHAFFFSLFQLHETMVTNDSLCVISYKHLWVIGAVMTSSEGFRLRGICPDAPLPQPSLQGMCHPPHTRPLPQNTCALPCPTPTPSHRLTSLITRSSNTRMHVQCINRVDQATRTVIELSMSWVGVCKNHQKYRPTGRCFILHLTAHLICNGDISREITTLGGASTARVVARSLSARVAGDEVPRYSTLAPVVRTQR